jgi:DNA-binding MarR family transcriptional regulator
MDEDLKKHWKLFVPVAIKVLERNGQKHDDELKKLFGISSIHIKYILILDTGKWTLKELSECLFFNKANTTRIISSLRSMGYVTDDRTSTNSRKYNVFLTPQGRELLEYLKKRIDSDIDIFFEDIPDEDVRKCLQVIERMCINIDKDGQNVEKLKKLEGIVHSDGDNLELKDIFKE